MLLGFHSAHLALAAAAIRFRPSADNLRFAGLAGLALAVAGCDPFRSFAILPSGPEPFASVWRGRG